MPGRIASESALKGTEGDVTNVLLCAIGHNLRLLLAWFRTLLLLIIAAILFPTTTAPPPRAT